MLKEGLKLARISYIIARLEWALEVSRLAILKMAPKPQIVRVRKTGPFVQNEKWVAGQNADYYIYINDEKAVAEVLAFPERSLN